MIIPVTQSDQYLCCGPQHAGPNVHHRCQGRACMAWRWAPGKAKSDERSVTDGYCGLAGAVS